ncbi:MAG TPA: CapA family protein, partial [Ktedonobacterales bacterium]
RRLLGLVRQTRATTHYLVVSAHWGSNWGNAPPPEHVLLGHALIEAGADVVFGHSAHVVRGIEIYRRRPILYSTGDFIDDYAIDPVDRNDESFIFVLEMQRRRLRRIELYPTVIEDMQARRARDDRAERIAGRMKRLSAALSTPMMWRARPGYLEVAPPAAATPDGGPAGAESVIHKSHLE